LIEFTGMVGAGKSLLADGVIRHLRAEGREVISLDAAVELVVARAPGLRRFAGAYWTTRLATLRGVLAFVSRWPRLSWLALYSQRRLPITLRHRRIILSLFFRQAGALCYVTDRLPRDTVVVLDEGPVHRAVNLFAWAPCVDETAVGAYLDALPYRSTVVSVAVPPPTAETRARSRGLPKRLDADDEAAVRRFFDNSAAVARIVESRLGDGRRDVLLIDNSVEPARALAELTAAVDGRLGADEPRRLSAPPLRRVRIPRPDRIGELSGRAAPWDPSVRESLARHYGFRSDTTLRPTARGGRSDTAIIRTDVGPKFAKRYKPGVPIDRVHHEHAVLAHLESRRFPAPRLVAAPDGTTVAGIDGRLYAVFDLYEQRFHYHDFVWPFLPLGEFVSTAAAALGELHRVLQDFGRTWGGEDGIDESDGRRPHDAAWARTTLSGGDGAAADRKSGAFVENGRNADVTTRLLELEASIEAVAPTRGTIHGDFGPYNVLFAWNEPAVIVDFELARYDWLLVDVAKALFQFGVNRSGFHIDRMRAFVAAYSDAAALDRRQLSALPAVWEYLVLRRVVVCWDRYRRTGGPSWLEEAEAKLLLASSIAARADTLAALQPMP
jgi:Ser/Thr protein kinase RdoA (MazF antagonist)